MKIMMEMIADLFADEEVFQMIGNQQINGVTEFLQVEGRIGINPNPRLLYLCDRKSGETLIQTGNSINILVVSKKTINFNRNAKLNMIWIKSGHEDLIFSRIADFFAYKLEFEEKKEILSKAMLSGKGLQYIIDEAFKVMDNPMFVSDLTYRVLAFNKTAQVEDPSWPTRAVMERENYERIQKLNEQGVFKRLYESNKPCLEKFDYSSWSWLAQKIVFNKQIIGHIAMVAAKREFKESDYELISFLAQLISGEVAKINEKQVISLTEFDHFIHDLLNARIQNSDLIKEQCEELKLNKNEHCLIVISYSGSAENKIPLVYIKNYLKRLTGNEKIVIDQSEVLIFEEKLKIEKYKNLTKFLGEIFMKAGISNPVKNWKELKKYVHQARQAIRLGSTSNETLFYDYQRYISLDLLDTLKKNADLKDYCHPSIFELIEYDQKHKTNYVNSLRIFLMNDSSVSKSAEIFSIHRNSMIYRIHKIEEIIGLSLEDVNLKFDLMMAYKILDIC